jgi:hypothetical protein
MRQETHHGKEEIREEGRRPKETRSNSRETGSQGSTLSARWG